MVRGRGMDGHGSGGKYSIDNVLDLYRSKVLRWNRQINLIGRSDPEATLDNLITHCHAALGALIRQQQQFFSTPQTFLYCDIGSGAGLPGVVWHAMLTDAGHRPRSFLIEPRNKRAWFLERVAGQLGLIDLAVIAKRWGDAHLPSGHVDEAWPPEDILLSIKALRISDTEVLGGLERGLSVAASEISAASAGRRRRGLRRVTIARFLPSDTRNDLATLAELGTVNATVHVAGEHENWRCVSRRVQVFPCPALAVGPAPISSSLSSSPSSSSSLLVSVFTTTD
jgi:hypothetical protein